MKRLEGIIVQGSESSRDDSSKLDEVPASWTERGTDLTRRRLQGRWNEKD